MYKNPCTQEEEDAYNQGMEDERALWMEFLQEWNGQTNSKMGKALREVVDRVIIYLQKDENKLG